MFTALIIIEKIFRKILNEQRSEGHNSSEFAWNLLWIGHLHAIPSTPQTVTLHARVASHTHAIHHLPSWLTTMVIPPKSERIWKN